MRNGRKIDFSGFFAVSVVWFLGCRFFSVAGIPNITFYRFIVALNLQTSFLTPPMAMAAYYLKGVAGDSIELIEIFKSIMPYLFIVIFTMVLMYNYPGLALYLPDFFFGIGK